MRQSLWLLNGLAEREWWQALMDLESNLSSGAEPVVADYARLFSSLLKAGHASVPHALAAELLYGSMVATPAALREGAIRQALDLDLAWLTALAARDWHGLTVSKAGQALPELKRLAEAGSAEVEHVASLLAGGLLDAQQLLEIYATQGQGLLASAPAFRWRAGALAAIGQPHHAGFEALHGLEPQFGQLREAVQRWLAGQPYPNILLYGPRGSGKSSAARALLAEYGNRGLRLVEVQPAELPSISGLLPRLAASPLRFVLFVDDLGFGRDDSGWQQLKTLLDGTLTPLPANVLLLATSNRRVLVPQRHGDRPDPLNDDAAGWDTLDEKLALADRFGLVITFPASDQRRYLEIVGKLALERGLDPASLEEEALRFARRGAGMSGRTARQFVDTRT